MTDPRATGREKFWQHRDPGRYRCPGCGCGRSEVQSFHVHHLDGNKENNDESNLVALCSSCHLGGEHNLDVDDPRLQPPSPSGTGPPKPSISRPTDAN
ncbi:HNH endonuclease signature motif containing protein [Haloferax volcanii]|uniref:HNH endonuclease signature motif containing protein n=1 Tax=Haloferax volcanii TaxID=2246 RepID=UPI0034E239C4|nr:HNH endonuclease [Haloferax alexandrinus]